MMKNKLLRQCTTKAAVAAVAAATTAVAVDGVGLCSVTTEALSRDKRSTVLPLSYPHPLVLEPPHPVHLTSTK